MFDEQHVMCSMCRRRVFFGYMDGVPLCATCADLYIERWQLAMVNPELARSLPSLEDLARL
jgi:hypothetical protein